MARARGVFPELSVILESAPNWNKEISNRSIDNKILRIGWLVLFRIKPNLSFVGWILRSLWLIAMQRMAGSCSSRIVSMSLTRKIWTSTKVSYLKLLCRQLGMMHIRLFSWKLSQIALRTAPYFTCKICGIVNSSWLVKRYRLFISREKNVNKNTNKIFEWKWNKIQTFLNCMHEIVAPLLHPKCKGVWPFSSGWLKYSAMSILLWSISLHNRLIKDIGSQMVFVDNFSLRENRNLFITKEPFRYANLKLCYVCFCIDL